MDDDPDARYRRTISRWRLSCGVIGGIWFMLLALGLWRSCQREPDDRPAVPEESQNERLP